MAMSTIDVLIRYDDTDIQLDKIAALSYENGLIYNDEGGDFKAHIKTALKFGALTAVSPLISMARHVRSAVFIFSGEFHRAGREFVGAVAISFITGGCFVGSLLSSVVYVISSGEVSFYVSMRRAYSFFEAWINQISLTSANLPSYSQRASGSLGFLKSRIWTTAPCMQPMLEKGFSNRGGLLDSGRIQKMFPLIQVNDVYMEKDKLVIQSEYQDENVHLIACGGAYEHKKISKTCCCCFRIESVYDRIFCCEIEKGSCTSMGNSSDSCGIVSCSVCGMGACCCYGKENHRTSFLNTGCFGPQGLVCISEMKSVI